MVVEVGLTLVEPLAEVEVNVPGVMATLAAPLVDQLNVLLAPELTLVGFAVNELMTGAADELTLTVAVAVADPALFVAVRVYVVVEVGLTLVEPLVEVEVNVPGVMATLAAPFVDQLNVLFAPVPIPVGFAANDEIVGFDPLPIDELPDVAQPARPTHASRASIPAPRRRVGTTDEKLWLRIDKIISIHSRLGSAAALALAGCSP